MSQARAITQAEHESIRRAVDLAWHRQLMRPSRMASVLRNPDLPFYTAEHRDWLISEGDWRGLVFKLCAQAQKDSQSTLLFRLRVGRLEPEADEVKRSLHAAIRARNGEFFHLFGQVLDQLQKPKLDYGLDRIDEFLLTHWDRIDGELAELFYYGQDSLALICQYKLDNPHLNTDLVKKRRQRLGLPAFRRVKRHVVITAGRLRHL